MRHTRSIMLLKSAASVGGAAEAIGKGLRGIGRAGMATFRGAGDAGSGLVRGVSPNASEGAQAIGNFAGKASLVGGTAYGAHKGKQKVDQWRYRHGFR